MNIKRIAVIGPESSGKSVLCELLAMHYGTVWIPEYSRLYLPSLKRKYTIEDVENIYMHQFDQERNQMQNAQRLIFTDTEFIIARVWCEYVFGFCPDSILQMIEKHPYDFYLLTAPDLPWEADPLRENPGKGNYFFEWYLRLLNAYGFRYGIVWGEGDERLKNAVALINNEFKAATI